MNRRLFAFTGVAALVMVTLLASGLGRAGASHSWGNYHWARASNPFTLQLGDNVDGSWDQYLRGASTDWNTDPQLLQTAVVPGSTNSRLCRATAGRIEVCNYPYGMNGWMGLAQVWISDGHIAQAVAKMNDTYFNHPDYNPSWWPNYNPAMRRLVMCQEIAHGFGLGHQDEVFNNANLGSCMDYTNDPDGTTALGPLNNEHPNAHDWAQLKDIYGHGDSTTGGGRPGGGRNRQLDLPAEAGNSQAEWGVAVHHHPDGRPDVFRRDLAPGQAVFTFVVWADPLKPGPNPGRGR